MTKPVEDALLAYHREMAGLVHALVAQEGRLEGAERAEFEAGLDEATWRGDSRGGAQ